MFLLLMRQTVIFVRDEQGLAKNLCSLKQWCCPACGRVGCFNRHDKLYGNNPRDATAQVLRGQRAWCSTRRRKGGCGWVLKFLLAGVIPRHTWNVPLLKTVLDKLTGGASIKKAWEALPKSLSLESAYHLLKRFRQQLDAVRSALISRCKPPGSMASDPLLQTIQHLRSAFPETSCPIEAFQMTFQRPIMG